MTPFARFRGLDTPLALAGMMTVGYLSLSGQNVTLSSPFPYIDKTMQLGYNSKDGLRNNSTEAAVYLQFESKDQLNNSPDTGQKVRTPQSPATSPVQPTGST